MNVESTTADKDVNIVITRSTPRNQTDNQTSENAGDVPADYASRQERMIKELIWRKTYPAPAEFDDADPMSNINLLGRTPRFDRDVLNEDDVYNSYATDGYFPGDIPHWSLSKFAWRAYVSCVYADLDDVHGRTLQRKREQFKSTLLTSL